VEGGHRTADKALPMAAEALPLQVAP